MGHQPQDHKPANQSGKDQMRAPGKPAGQKPGQQPSGHKQGGSQEPRGKNRPS